MTLTSWRISVTLLCTLVCALPFRAASQTEGQLAAWAAIVGSPAGAYAPALLVAAFQRTDSVQDFEDRSGWGVLASTWKRTAVARNYNAGVAFARTVGPRKAIELTASFLTPGCPACDGEVMAGMDFESLVLSWPREVGRGELAIFFDASGGYGRWPRADDGENMSLVARLPLVISRRVSSRSTVRAFFSPGLGWGRVAIDGTGRSALVPLLGGGIELGLAQHVAVEVASQRIVVPDPYGDYPATIGAAIRFRQ